MKRRTMLLSLICGLCLPLTMQAQGISKKAMEQLRQSNNTTCYVNTKAPGVHKEWDRERGEYVWKTGMGGFLCSDKNMKPLHDMDKTVYFTGVNNDPDNPKVSNPNLNNVQKVWDEERGCYVWKDIFGNFLGRDKPSIDKQKEWAKKNDPNWMEKGRVPKKKLNPEAEKTQKELQKLTKELEKETSNLADQNDEAEESDFEGDFSEWDDMDDMTNLEARRMIITSDEQLREAEAGLREARAAIAAARAQGVDVSEYADLSAIDQVEKAINEYKRARSRIK